MIGQLMEARDRERLKTELNHGVRLAQSLGLDVTDVVLPFSRRLQFRRPPRSKCARKKFSEPARRHRGRRADLEGERRSGDDLGEAVDLAGAGAAHEREPLVRGRQRRAAADGSDLEARETDRGVQAAIDATPRAVGHRARPDHPEVLSRRCEYGGDRRRRRERDRLHAGGDSTVRPDPGERFEIGGGRVEHAPIASSVSVASAITVLPWPDWKNSNDGFLSPPMFASSIARSICTGEFGSTNAMFSAYALRVIMFGPTASPVVHRHSTWHIGPTTCVFASRSTAYRESSGMSELRDHSRISPTRSSIQRASASASPASRQTKQDARVIRSRRRMSGTRPTARRPSRRAERAVSPPSVCASGTTTSSSARPVSTTSPSSESS